MATWPATLPDVSFSVGYGGSKMHNTIRTPYEAGYVGTRARFTRDRMIFRCGWAALSETHFNTFMTFVDTCKGGGDTFSWDDNAQSSPVTYTMRFQEDSIAWDLVKPSGKYKVAFVLEEV